MSEFPIRVARVMILIGMTGHNINVIDDHIRPRLYDGVSTISRMPTSVKLKLRVYMVGGLNFHYIRDSNRHPSACAMCILFRM